jgi:hypothetical protein
MINSIGTRSVCFNVNQPERQEACEETKEKDEVEPRRQSASRRLLYLHSHPTRDLDPMSGTWLQVWMVPNQELVLEKKKWRYRINKYVSAIDSQL